jgi:preprotein translocase subunit SecD
MVVNTSLGPAEPERSPSVKPGAGTPAAGTPAATPAASPTPVPGPVYPTILQGKDLESAAVGFDQQTSRPEIQFVWKDDAAATFQEFTGRNVGKVLAITVDKRVINSATIQSQIGKSGRITGVSLEEAQRIVIQLKSGALEVPLEVIQSRTVGPSLGQDSLRRSLIAGIVGLAVVALFMVGYYRLPGVLAVLARRHDAGWHRRLHPLDRHGRRRQRADLRPHEGGTARPPADQHGR